MVLIVLGEYVSSYTILDMMKEMGLDENSFIKFNDFLEVYVVVVPWISRVYWICTTKGSSMYSRGRSPRGIHTAARGCTNNTHADTR